MKHRAIEELLPWYVNGTLQDREKRLVEQHLGGCAGCARQVEDLRSLGSEVTRIAEETPSPSPALLPQALSKIAALERDRRGGQERSGLLERIGMAVTGWWTPVPSYARVALVAQLVVLAGLAIAVIARSPGPSISETASEQRGALQPTEDRARILVGFREEAAERDLRRAILAVGGRIIDGPSSLGLYTVELPVPSTDTAKVQLVLDDLRRRADLVRFAEPVR